jgi:hypothetical protein
MLSARVTRVGPQSWCPLFANAWITPLLAALALVAAACDPDATPPERSPYRAFEGRWTGTAGGEDFDIAVSVAFGRGLIRVQDSRGMAWQALPAAGPKDGRISIDSRFGDAIALALDGTDGLTIAVQVDGRAEEGRLERWGEVDFARLDLSFAAANALTNPSVRPDGSGYRFKGMKPGTDRAMACASDNDDILMIDLFEPVDPLFVRSPAGPAGVSPDAQHAFRIIAASQDPVTGNVTLALESIEPRSDTSVEVAIEGVGTEKITLRPSGAVYADCTGPAIAD